MVKDLVCGMDVDERRAVPRSVYQGQTYYFCVPLCKKAFDKDPARYVPAVVAQTDSSAAAAQAQGAAPTAHQL